VTRARTVDLPPLLTPRRRRWLLALVANGLARALLVALGMVLLRVVLAQPDTGVVQWPVAVLAASLAGGLLAAALLHWRESLDAEALAQHYIAHVRLRLFDRLAQLTPAQAQRRSRGGVLLRFIGDVQALRGWVGRGIARGVVAATMLVTLWLLLLATAPALAAAVLGIVAIGAWAIWRLHGPLYQATALARRRQASVAAYMQDRIAGLATMQLAAQATRERQRLSRLNQRLRRAMQQRAQWRGWHRAVAAMVTGTLLVTLALHGGARLDSQGIGGLVGSALVVLLMLPALRGLAQAAQAWVAARVALARVAEFLQDDGPVAPADGAPQPPTMDTPSSRPTLVLAAPHWNGRVSCPSADVAWGRRIALCGPAGAGKTALLQLIAGQQQPDEGAIFLDELPLDAMPPARLRRLLGLLSPDAPLLRGTVGDNVRYQAWQPSPEALEHALALSGLQAMLPGLPAGLDTPVRDGGLNLSHGQRRAVQLARTLAARPAVLLIDDPGACLPGHVEDRLQVLLDGFAGTVLFATTDPSLAVLADEIWTFEGGHRASVRPVVHRQRAGVKAAPPDEQSPS
jgi:ABC-type multidrug transport system fused ATPase/permease subunit